MPAASEPTPVAGSVSFEEGDFHALSEGLSRDPQYNDARLKARRKLLALGKRVAAEAKGLGVALESRTSLHNPHQFNGMRVRRLWTYICRAKAEKTRLKRVLGADLAKDLDAAYRNAYLCIALEADAIEVSFRIHPDGWYDGQNLVRRVGAEGAPSWLAILDELDGYRLRLHDWKGEWRCGQLTADRIDEFLKYYQPGEHALVVDQRLPAPPGARGMALEAEMPDLLVEQVLRLVPLYRYAAWSKESDFLFG